MGQDERRQGEREQGGDSQGAAESVCHGLDVSCAARSDGSVTGARHAKLRQTYAVALPSRNGRSASSGTVPPLPEAMTENGRYVARTTASNGWASVTGVSAAMANSTKSATARAYAPSHS